MLAAGALGTVIGNVAFAVLAAPAAAAATAAATAVAIAVGAIRTVARWTVALRTLAGRVQPFAFAQWLVALAYRWLFTTRLSTVLVGRVRTFAVARHRRAPFAIVAIALATVAGAAPPAAAAAAIAAFFVVLGERALAAGPLALWALALRAGLGRVDLAGRRFAADRIKLARAGSWAGRCCSSPRSAHALDLDVGGVHLLVGLDQHGEAVALLDLRQGVALLVER